MNECLNKEFTLYTIKQVDIQASMVGLTWGGKIGISVFFEFMPIFKEICSHTEIFLRYRKQYTPFYFGVFGKGKTDAYK